MATPPRPALAEELPPRARRILATVFNHGQKLGTTSACAENTGFGFEFAYGFEELPPRARRIRLGTRIEALMRGTTSACAENTGKIAFPFTSFRNYLRVRGEYYGSQLPGVGITELPPRARRIRL